MPSPVWLALSQVAIIVFTLVIAWLTHRTYLLLPYLDPDFNVLLSLPETISRLVLVGMCLALAWLSGLPAGQLGLISGNLWWSAGVGAVIGLAAQLVVFGLTTLAINRFGRHIYSPWLILNILPRRPAQWLWVALAFIPPVVMEELLFRSLWLGGFSQTLPLWLLVLGTSLAFGWMHQAQGKLGMIMAGGLNVLLSLVFIWTSQLLVTIVAHYTLNMIQLLAAHFQRDTLLQNQPQSIDKTPAR